MRAVVVASDAVEVTVRPEVSLARSLMSRTPLSCSSCLFTTVTTMGTSCRFSFRFWAVTTTVSTV